MNLSRELENSGHRSFEKIARDGADRYSDRSRNTLFRHKDTRAYYSLNVSVCVGMFAEQNEVNDIAVDFRSCESGGERIGNWNWFDQRHGWRRKLAAHDLLPPHQGKQVCQEIYTGEAAALSFYIFSRIARTPSQNANRVTSASFQSRSSDYYGITVEYPITIRGSVSLPVFPALIREARLMFPRERATSYDATSRRNLASDGFIIIARSFYSSRDHSQRFNTFENSERNRANTLGRVGAMRCKSSSHGRQQTMRGISGGTIQVAKRANHV